MSAEQEPNGVAAGDVKLDVLGEEETLPDSKEKLEEEDEDPWEATNLTSHQTPWNELDTGGRVKRVLWEYLFRVLLLLLLLYMFICSLDFLSSAFRLLGGRAAGRAFANNEVLKNPVAGLMVGVLATVLVQSSSTSTSITITMVGAGLLKPGTAVPIIMGANIGTSVTNTIVSLGHVHEKNDFRRAFGGATVHDVFNWLSVLILLPIEVISGTFMKSGVLSELSGLVVNSMNLTTYTEGKRDLLKTITKPFTKLVISVDTKAITKIATSGDAKSIKSLIKIWCTKESFDEINNVTIPGEKCPSMFMNVAGVWPDETIGAILLVLALIILCVCLVCIVRLLHLLLRGQIAVVLKRFVNADFPGCLKHATGYLAILIGAVLTILVQSSSIFTSAITPLVGVGVLKIQRMYPLTLGSNIGTTSTGILASLATSGENLPKAMQVAFVHFFFNIFGIMIWYPLPWLRKVPINIAKQLGNTTAKYRWFALVYLALMFLILPAAVFGLSLAGWVAAVCVLVPLALILIIVIVINVLQNKRPKCLPDKIRNWDFLPLWLHSLQPYDNVMQKLLCCKRCKKQQDAKKPDETSSDGVVNRAYVTSM